MKKIHLALILILLAGIAASVWHAGRPEAVISYGPQEQQSAQSEQGARNDTAADAEPLSTDPSTSRPVVQDPAPVRVTAPECDTVRISVESAVYVICAEGEMSVFAAMQKGTAEGLTFTGKEHTGLGFYVESINGKQAENGYYWFLYINDESSSMGASETLVRPRDAIEWRYKQSY